MIFSGKNIKVIFVILILIIISEVIYMLFYKKTEFDVKSRNNNSILNSSNVTGYIKQTNQEENNKSQALDDLTIESLKNIKKGSLMSSTLINEYKSTINKIDTKGGVSPTSGFRYKVRLELIGDDNNKFSILLSEKDLDNTVVFTKIDNQDKKINIQNLNIGDKIIIRQKKNLLEISENNLLSMEIEKI